MNQTLIQQPQDSELLIYNLDFNKSNITRALEITADYVAKFKLILTGGTAIDMALRSKGTSIYDDMALPDYDIISDVNLNHATALAELLCNEGFRDINVINAIHITTVRVRIKNVTLLDATFVPKVLMDSIPYLDIGQFRLVHPNYQKIDQRLSLATLMADTGASLNIFNRLLKDNTRNNILRDWFDIEINKETKILMKRVKLPLSMLQKNDKDIEYINVDKSSTTCFIYTGDLCITGFFAYALFYNEYIKLHEAMEDTIDPNLVFTSTHVEFDIPEDAYVSFLNCNNRTDIVMKETTKIIGDQSKAHKYNAITNLKPITLKSNLIEISDSYGKRFGATIINNMMVACVDYVLMEFLRDRVFACDDHMKDINTMYYNSLLQMVVYNQDDANQVSIDASQVAHEAMSGDDYDHSIWFPTINCYGYDLLPEYKAFAFEKLMYPEEAKLLKPKTSYLRIPKCVAKSEFDSSSSHYFQIDGMQNDNIEHTNLKWIVDAIKK